LSIKFQDISSLAQLIEIEYFSTESFYEEKKEDVKQLCQVKKSNSKGHEVLTENLRVIQWHQQHILGHFLRRTTSSVDYMSYDRK